jgi:hypothetical protein
MLHVCAKTACVNWLSIESGQINYFYNFLSLNHYFRKYFKLVYTKNVVMVTLTTGIMFLIFTCMNFWVGWGILRRWSTCAQTTYEVVCDCRKFQKHLVQSLILWSTNFMQILLKVSSCFKETRNISITKISYLTLFKEITALYSENHMKPINAPCGQTAELFTVKVGSTYMYHYHCACALKS